MAKTLLSVRAAQARILRHFQPVKTETIPLRHCAGRVLAGDAISIDLPLFDNSSVDGFAVIAADLAEASQESPRRLSVVADIPAGSFPRVRLKSGQAARIMTGAPIPQGADSVVMLEDVQTLRPPLRGRTPSWIQTAMRIEPGRNVRRRGADTKKGQRVLTKGRRLRPQDLGMLAMLNAGKIRVHRKPRIALISSGNELVRAGRPLRPGKVRETNSLTLSALIREAGCEVLALGIARDTSRAIKALLDRAAREGTDLIVSSAGVSVGALDLVRQVVQSHGRLGFWRVNVRPGKPVAFGEYRGVPLIGLPGNPVSAFIGFQLFVRPALDRLAGVVPSRRHLVNATLQQALESDGRESYLRAVVQDRGGSPIAKLVGHQGSGDLFSLVRANALLIIPAGVKSRAVGDQVKAWLL